MCAILSCANANRSNFCYILYLFLIVLNNVSITLQTSETDVFQSVNATTHYLTNLQIGDLFKQLEKQFPQYAQAYTLGNTVQGRPIHALALSVFNNNNNQHERNLLRPAVKFTANLHGDETVGRQMIIYFAQYLILNYATNGDIEQLLNNTEIHFLPSVNPDGFAAAKEGNCESLPHYVGRTNAAGVDLNRDFPDRLDDQYALSARALTRQPETAALIEWILKIPFVLSANFHGGAIVASYPFDNSINHNECCAESLTPDDRVFKLMAHTYADNNPLMRKGNSCNDTFKDGITNGANWYELNGGMQDFNYAFSNCFELTIELTCCKYPPASQLPEEWKRNKHSMLELLKLAHIGIKGLVKDANGYPIKDANVIVAGLENKSIRTTDRGEYWRLLTPGLYSVQAVAFGYQSSDPQEINVTNDNLEAQRLDFVLLPDKINYDGAFRKLKVERSEKPETNYGFLTPVKFEHHNYNLMTNYLHNIASSFPSITRLYSIGKSVQQRDLWVMEISRTPGKHVPGVPEFKYVANMHGNEIVGKEMLLYLTKYICELYLHDDRITELVNNTRMHFLYSMNPDGYEMSSEGDRSSLIGRTNAHNRDLNRNFPDQYGTDEHNRVAEPEVTAVMNWTLSIPFVLSANLHGGSLVANYPYDDNEKDFEDPITRLRDATIKGRKLNPTEDNELFKHLSKTYSQAHPTMHLGKPCPLFKKERFTDGITNGAQWYSVTGGMQDWNYVRAGVLEITIEMGCDKFPLATELPKLWQMNREPLLRFIEQVHFGVHGFVTSSIGTPVIGAAITLDGAKHAIYSGTHGDYWKLALPGKHNITVLADGYTPEREEIEIPETETRNIRLDITLMRDDPQHWASANDFRIIENVVKTYYHSNAEIREQLAKFENRMGQIAAFGYGESEFGFNYDSLKLTADIGAPDEEKFKILVVSSFTNTAAALGREMTMNLARHIVEGYTIREPPILRLLKNSVIYILPIPNQFEQILYAYTQNQSLCDPVVANSFGDRILSPENDKKRDLFLQFLEAEHFDLVLTFSSGNSEIIYPKSDEIFEKLAHNIEKMEFSFSPLHCPTTATRTVQYDVTTRVTEMFQTMYHIPLYTIGLSCCGMPKQEEIASVWRQNLDKIKNFMRLIETGVTGRVQSPEGQQLREAVVQLRDHTPIYNVSKNAAHFRIVLPAGEYELEINAAGYDNYRQRITVLPDQLLDMGVITIDKMLVISGYSEAINAKAKAHTIVTGFILDEGNHPIKGAKVSVVKPFRRHVISNHTDYLGAYIIHNVPVGDVTLEVEASGYLEEARSLQLSPNMEIRAVIVHLKVTPRYIIIIFGGLLGLLAAVSCMFFGRMLYKAQGKDKRYYSFSLLPQKGRALFEEDGEEGETELFRSPIKRGMAIKPYYDELNLEVISDTDLDEDADETNSNIAVMYDKRTN